MSEEPLWKDLYRSASLEQLREYYRAVKVQAHLLRDVDAQLKFIHEEAAKR